MTESLSLRLQIEDAQRLRKTLQEPWEKEHHEAMRAWDWDFIVARCLLLAESLDVSWKNICREAVDGEIDDPTDKQTALKEAFERTLEVFGMAAEGATAFVRQTGMPVERLGELATVKDQLQRKRDRYLTRLSLLDPEIIQTALAERAAGNYTTAAQALADLLAARHAEQITPGYAELRAWANESVPPDSWRTESD
jgi:hypothetical protein